MRARITHEFGSIRLHSDGPWEELTEYEVAELVRQAMSALQGKMLFRQYPPATRYWEDGVLQERNEQAATRCPETRA